MEDDVLKILREIFTDSITLPPSKLYQDGDLFKNKMEEYYYRMGDLISQQEVIKDLEYGLKDLFTSLYKDLMPEVVFRAEQLGITLDFFIETPFLIKAIRDFKNPNFGDLPLTIYYKYHYKGKAIIDDFPMDAEEIEITTDTEGKPIFVHDQLLAYTYYKFKHPLYVYQRLSEVGVPDTIQTTEGLITLPDGDLVFKELGVLKSQTVEPDFSVTPESASIFVGSTKDFTVTIKGGLLLTSIRVSTSNSNQATVSINGNIITVTAKAQANNVNITVSSTEIPKTQVLSINIRTVAQSGRFKANNLGIPKVDGRWVNLDIRDGELTFEPADGVNIVLCGMTNSASTPAGTMNVMYLLKKKPNGSSGVVLYEPANYTPVEGQPYTVVNGFAVEPDTGETIPQTFINIDLGFDGQVIISAEETITDIELVEQYVV